MSVDIRTRVDGRVDLPEDADAIVGLLVDAFADRAELLAGAAAALAPPPLVIDTDGVVVTLTAIDGALAVRPGPVDAGTRLRLGPGQLAELVADQVTPMGWFSSGQLQLEGRLHDVLDWWLLVRGALDGVAPTQPGEIDFSDSDGAPLDLRRSFTLDDHPDDQRRFLEQAGYLHLRGVFDPGEMQAISADMDAAAPTYAPGDGRSWWATVEGGEQTLVRMQRFDELSGRTAAMIGDARLERVAALTGDGHAWSAAGFNRIEALFKPIGVVQGISDVPWHKDCSLGRHSYECCNLTVGVSVTGADEVSGQLHVVAGSNRAHVWPALLQPGMDLPVVPLPTETGDVTVHLSCTLHMAQPPTERERRVLYSGFRLPAFDAAAAEAGRARIRAVRESAPVSVSQPSAATRRG